MANVVGKVSGSGDEWIVVGAHLDGLGMAREGDDAGLPLLGADDNASGVAALLLIAGQLAAAPDLLRSVLFVAFEGEEIGLLGSRAFVAAPPLPLETCTFMINLDTVGRMEDERLILFGSETAAELPAILRGVGSAFTLKLALNTSGAWASDHTPFYESGIPVIHAFTGANADYHKVGDIPEKLNVEGIVSVADYAGELALHFATTPSHLTFVPPGSAAPKPTGPPRRVSLGTIPDFAQGKGGVKLSGVTPGSAAEAAGLEEGDVIVGIGDADVDTIEDFQAALAAHAPGDEVEVKFVRAGVFKLTKAVLRERK
jgi:membrane-associated protease RseP (regulator of RpoE activity)